MMNKYKAQRAVMAAWPELAKDSVRFNGVWGANQVDQVSMLFCTQSHATCATVRPA
jgi:hypothetical protein